jgi:hypothetical protein
MEAIVIVILSRLFAKCRLAAAENIVSQTADSINMAVPID